MSDLCCALLLKKWRLAVLLLAWDESVGDLVDDHHVMEMNGADQGPAQDLVSREGDPPCLEEIREFFNRHSSRCFS